MGTPLGPPSDSTERWRKIAVATVGGGSRVLYVCPVCGAICADPEQHREWHDE